MAQCMSHTSFVHMGLVQLGKAGTYLMMLLVFVGPKGFYGAVHVSYIFCTHGAGAVGEAGTDLC